MIIQGLTKKLTTCPDHELIMIWSKKLTKFPAEAAPVPVPVP
jgi:hypothetical protein